MNQTYDYWKDDLRTLGRSKDFEAFSSVLDRTTWSGHSYEISCTSYRLLSAAMEHVHRLQERGTSSWKLDAFSEILAPVVVAAFLRDTVYRVCRRAGLPASEASRHASRGLTDVLPQAYQTMVRTFSPGS
jgi:hypothetical protein